MRVFITGGTGLVGTRLIRRLKERLDRIVVLSRRSAVARDKFGPDCTIVEGDPMQPGPWMDAVADCDAVVHLAGENIFGHRWNVAFKQRLLDSRVQSTHNIVEALARAPRTAAGNSKILVNASAIGYYGPHGDEELTEDSPPGTDMLANLCVQWEKEARGAEAHGVRVAMIRVGVVLDKEGGPLKKLSLPFKLGLGGPVGSGKQYMSWIHHDDLVGLILLALDHANASGPINGTAPNPVTNKSFGRAFGRALHRPAILPTPAFALRLMLGEAAMLATEGQRVLPKRAQALGYRFKYSTIEAALAEIFG
jgi:uncharacterized protein (TIGR01777 family)